MGKITSKQQIAQAKECVVRLDKYVRMLSVTVEMLGFAKSAGTYNKLPAEHVKNTRRDIMVIIADLLSMKSEAEELALHYADKAHKLELERKTQLEEMGVANSQVDEEDEEVL